MSDQEHTPRDSEAEPNHNDAQPPQVDPFHMDEPQLIDPDTVELADAQVSPETVEPELSVSADDVQLVEPSLNPAKISDDTARAASLEETAAEARRVEQEALDAGQLVAGTVPSSDPASQMAPAGTAPAGGAAGDTGEKPPTPAADAAEVDEAPEVAAPAADAPAGAEGAPDPAEESSDPIERPLDSNDATRSLPSFAADAKAPQWTPAATDEQRWDSLFDETENLAQAGATHDSPDTAEPGTATADVGTGPESTGGEPSDAEPSDTAPSATAPAETAPSGSATSNAATSNAVTSNAATKGPGAESPVAAGTASSYPEAPDGPQPEPSGGPYGLPPAGTHPTRREGREESGKTPRNRNLLIGGALLGVLALGLLIWGLITLIGGLTASPDREPVVNSTPGADGIIAENVLPLDIEEGQCLRDFVDINSESTVVTCSTPHNAQLLATAFYAEADEFPGDAALALRAQEVCDGVDLDEGTAARYENLELLRVTPRQGSWSDGDRRVDCLVTSSEGNIINDTLISE